MDVIPSTTKNKNYKILYKAYVNYVLYYKCNLRRKLKWQKRMQ